MSFRPDNYETAKANYKPMRRSAMRSGASLRSSKPMKRSRMKQSKIDPADVAWRKAVIERDGRKCRWPTENDSHHRGRLHAHHINERSQRPDLVYDINNGATLCSFHHDYAHHSVMGRRRAKELGLLGGETYELAQKKARPV